jgi:hypothetical protein
MLVGTLFLTAALLTDGPRPSRAEPEPPQEAAGESAAEVVTLKDGTMLLGVIQSNAAVARADSPSRGVQPFVVVVRRGWAETHLRERLARWDKLAETSIRKSIRPQQERLTIWRRERLAARPNAKDDPIIAWIDAQLALMNEPSRLVKTPLLRASIGRGEIRRIDRRPAAATRLLSQAWLLKLEDPEDLSLADLRQAIEARGLLADASKPVSLDPLLPPIPESEPLWLARKAATEITVDSDLRFIRFENLLLPDQKLDPAAGLGLSPLNLSSALGDISKLLGLEPNQSDPLVEALERIGAQSRHGAVVTQLRIAPNLSTVTVAVTFWVRGANGRWYADGQRTASVRPDDIGPQAGAALADDKQVQAAFQMVEALGLGAVSGEMKQRSLRIGAAVQQALDLARSEFNQELDRLAFPVLEPGDIAAAPPQPSDLQGESPEPAFQERNAGQP